MKIIAALFASALLAAQEPAPKQGPLALEAKTPSVKPDSEKTVEELEAEKRDPRKRARKLLDASAEAAGGARPQVQVVALMHIADNYHQFDPKQSLEYFQQAFAAAAGLPADESGGRFELQSAIVTKVAGLNTSQAIAMLQQMPPEAGPFRARAAERLVAALLNKKDVEQAAGLMNLFQPTDPYPYRAVSAIFKALPEDDPRRVTLFSNAMAAYAAHPERAFGDLIAACWRTLPKSLAESSVNTLVSAILDRKDDDGFQTESVTSAKGAVSFDSKKDAELFDILPILQQFDPKKAQDILDTRPKVRAALQQYPEGSASLDGGDGRVGRSVRRGTGQPDAQQEAQQRLWALASARAAAANAALSESPERALSIAKTIPVPMFQAQALGNIAKAVAERDPGMAKGILGQCISLLDDLKQPQMRAEEWSAVAEAAFKIKDDKLAWRAIDRALADASDLLKQDTDSDMPNTAPVEYWPSTQAYRRAMITATKLFQVDAEPALLKITDPDLALLAKIQMAEALLGRTTNEWNVMVNRKKAK
jgi:hypothetical protein